MADKEVLIEIKVDNKSAQKAVTDLTKSIESNKKATKDLEIENKRLAKSGQQNSKQYRENAELIAINKNELSNLTRERKRAINTSNAEKGTLTALRNERAKLTEQRNRDLKVGSKEFDDQNKRIKGLTQEIKAGEEAGDNFTSSVGKYQNALTSTTGSISAMSPALGGMINGIMGATRAAIAFIATPLGLILSGIALALASVFKYFQRTEEGGDKLAVGMAVLSGVFEGLMDVVASLGKILFEVFVNGFKLVVNNFKIQGLALKEVVLGINVAWQKVFGSVEDYEKAQDDLKKNTEEIIKVGKEQVQLVKDTAKAVVEETDALVENVGAIVEKTGRTADLTRAEQALRKETRINTVEEAQRRQDIQKDLLITRDFTVSYEKRREALLRATETEKESLAVKLRLGKLELDQARERFAINNSDADAADEKADAEAKFIAIKTESFKKQRELSNRLTEQQNRERNEQKQKVKLEEETTKKQINNANDLAILQLEKKRDSLTETRAVADAEIAILDEKFAQENQSLRDKLAEENAISLEQLNTELANGTLRFASLESIEYEHAQKIIKINEDADAEIIKSDEKVSEEKKKNIEAEKKARQDAAQYNLNVISQVLNAAQTLAGDNFELQKAFSIGQAIINTAQGITKAFAQGGALGFATGGAVAAAGAIQVAKIASTTPESGSSGGVAPISGNTPTPTPQIDTSSADTAQAENEALEAAISRIGLSVSVTEINDAQVQVSEAESGSSI